MGSDLPFPYQNKILLSHYSTFGIGGPARYFAEATTKEQMQEMLSYAYDRGIAVHILGKGSNSLFDDRGFDGLVILNRIDYLKQHEGCFTVGSGYGFARLGGITARSRWGGLEFAAGIPATVGGAIFMNAGANGQETAAVLIAVDYITERGEGIHFRKKELEFGYRCSSFHQMKGAIVEGMFQLTASAQSKTQQKELLQYRLKTQPYGDKSAGCAFRNPMDSAAGYLIERAGLKGMRIGGAAVSEIHGNFIVNMGDATTQDVLALVEKIKEKVHLTQGIVLEKEIRYIPYISHEF